MYVSCNVRDENLQPISEKRDLHLSQNCSHEFLESIPDNDLKENSGIGSYLRVIDIIRTYVQEE